MAVEVSNAPLKGKLVVRNLGLVLSGDLDQPLIDADAIVAVDGRIAAIGRAADLDTAGAVQVIDAKGSAVSPGLIDSHCHPVFGDWTPRQNQLGWIEMGVNGGVTTLVSAGEVHLPGRPKDAEGVVALAITAQRCFQNFRPAGAQVIAGAPVPELGFARDVYERLKAAGIRHIGEIGSARSPRAPTRGRWSTGAARSDSNRSCTPAAPRSPARISSRARTCWRRSPTSSVNQWRADLRLAACVRAICEQARGAIEIVHNGNERSALTALEACRAAGRLGDFIIGTDAPAGSGVQPNGMLRMVTLMASLGGLPAEAGALPRDGNVAASASLTAGGSRWASRPTSSSWTSRRGPPARICWRRWRSATSPASAWS